MQLLLLKDVRHLGHVGDVVTVRPGYARNYLVPCGLATEPTEENIQAIAEEKKRAAAARAQRAREFAALAEQLADVTITIEAAANPEGTLYGSVGRPEIVAALAAQGFTIKPDQVVLDSPIRTLDNRVITLEFTDEISAQVKVWVVREGGAADVEPTGDAVEDESDTELDED